MKQLITTLCNANGVGGYTEVCDAVKTIVTPLVDRVQTDALGNVAAIRRCGKEKAPLLLLEAHIDEIGFVVTHVDENGFVHVSNCGGIDRRVLAATEVTVLTQPPLVGVFCSTPPHLAGDDNKLKSIDEMGIDVGLSAEEAKSLIAQGTRVAFRANACELGEYRLCSKALDDRVGCAAVIRALELLQHADLKCDVAALFAVQEEIGGAGAAVGAFSLEPQAAIVTDVSFAVTPDAQPHKCGELGKGPMLGMAPSLDLGMTSHLRMIAEREDILLQYEVMGGATGTDADGVYVSRCGVPTALLSIPQRYMHTPNEVVDVRDAEAVARLMAAAAKEGIVC